MGQISVKASAILAASPEKVYRSIADYQNGHPHIVPPETFSDLHVEQGGYGDGTVITFKVTVLGTVQSFRQRISEPEPGRVLVEQDIDSVRNAITTFTVDPVENGEKSHVEIATTMNASPGLAGMVEHILVPLLNSRIYREELKRLESFAQQ